ncbi:hypothetical protein TWF730_005422 [Orbilia blumenaviensis]|uniref:A to I editase domain-containing protein n=1 Tax=Orbilia blumenaviensis TaxID=1796055 RepID=A0AAV9VKI8_9PEZI
MEERIAQLALATFNNLPAKCKPRTNPNVHEWVPMSAIILAHTHEPHSNNPTSNSTATVCNLEGEVVAQVDHEHLHLASLATGSKCLPATTLSVAGGLILHDSHSEILALRGLNRFLLEEARHMLIDPHYRSRYLVRNRNHDYIKENTTGDGSSCANGGSIDGGISGGSSDNEPPFALHPATSIHLFSTEPPCGDASMEFIISAQQDPTPWSLPPEAPTENLPGRSYFSALSIVRRKPSRPDAPPTLSKSCTDKLTLKQFTSALSSLSSIIICPRNVYISTFTVPFDKYNEEGYTRAFTTSTITTATTSTTGSATTIATKGRLSALPSSLTCPTLSHNNHCHYSFHPLTPTPLPSSFPFSHHYKYSKPATTASNEEPNHPKRKSSNISTIYMNHLHQQPVTEALISGVKQGNSQLSTSADDRKGSVVCRKKMWLLAREIAGLLRDGEVMKKLDGAIYADLKRCDPERKQVKELVTGALMGWEKNRGDDHWGL